MKKIIFIGIFFLFLGGIFYVSAQDLIILRDGDTIESRIVEISPTEARYRRFTHLDGPIPDSSEGTGERIARERNAAGEAPVNWLSGEATFWGLGLRNVNLNDFFTVGLGLRYERSLNDFFTLGLNAFFNSFIDSNGGCIGILATTKLFFGSSFPLYFELGMGWGMIERTTTALSTPSVYSGFMVTPAIGLRFGRQTKGLFADIFFSAPAVLYEHGFLGSTRFGVGLGGAW